MDYREGEDQTAVAYDSGNGQQEQPHNASGERSHEENGAAACKPTDTAEEDRTLAFYGTELQRTEPGGPAAHWEKSIRRESAAVLSGFRSRGFGIVMFALSAVSLLRCGMLLSAGQNFRGVLSGLQALLFSGVWLSGVQTIRQTLRRRLALTSIVGLALTLILSVAALPVLSLTQTEPAAEQLTEEIRFSWPTAGLGSLLPEPTSGVWDMYTWNMYTSADSFSASAGKISNEDYQAYVQACQNCGFNVDTVAQTDCYQDDHGSRIIYNYSGSYIAYNAEGYELNIYYYDSDMHIDLYAPRGTGKLNWSGRGIAEKLPVPQSAVGSIAAESENNLTVFVGETDQDAFNDYIEACREKGFTLNYSRDRNGFYAENEEGYQLSIIYKGFQTMEIDLYAP